MYQSGRAGEEAKKRKSPAKSGRFDITEIVIQQINRSLVWYLPSLRRMDQIEFVLEGHSKIKRYFT